MGENHSINGPFMIEELQTAIDASKLGKVAGRPLSGIFYHHGSRAKHWILKFLNKIFKLPSLMKKPS